MSPKFSNKIKIENIAVLSTESIGGNVDILVGIDIITKGNFTITNKNKKLSKTQQNIR